MASHPLITNDRQEKEVTAVLDQIERALSSQQMLEAMILGLPPEVTELFRRALAVEKDELAGSLDAYQSALSGDSTKLVSRAGHDIGARLIAARVAKGWKQKDLARRLFLPEQQIQRYEAEKYKGISLAGLIRVTRALGVRISVDLTNPLQEPWLPSHEMTAAEYKKILLHAREHGWLDKEALSDEAAMAQIRRSVAEHVSDYGTPSLLRTGLNVVDYSQDWSLLAWKAQVTRKALALSQKGKNKYRPYDVIWLRDLVKLSALPDGPSQARALLAERGIILVVEPQIAGMKIDGAAFLADDTPVIGLTLRRDFLDNFWFTLLHEVAHIVLHYRTGLSSGFFDDVTNVSVDELEAEANDFASNLLIPDEIWKKSAARISKSPEPIERLAAQLGIAPAIIFGRIRKERNNFSIFSDKIGAGQLRKRLLSKSEREYHDAGN